MFLKLEQFLFYFLLIAIPFNLRKVLYYPGWLFSEWESVSLFLTDILLISLFILWAVSSFTKKYGVGIKYYGFKSILHNTKYIILKADFFLIIFAVFALISIKEVNNIAVGMYHWFKLLEFILFYFYLKNYAFKKFDEFKILMALFIGGFSQGAIAIGQLVKQSDLGLWMFGEGVLGSHIPGVAIFFNSAGERIMRAYGTTPHSNILAGYLLLTIFAAYFLWFKYVSYFPEKKARAFFLVTYSVIIFGFLASFSRTTVFVFVLVSVLMALYLLIKEKYRVRPFKILITATLASVILFSFFYLDESMSRLKLAKNDEAVQLRIYFAGESISKNWNLTGIGWGNFVPWLMEKNPNKAPWLYQPVHNIYLLVYSEAGILGAAFFGLFLISILFSIIKKRNAFMLLCFFAFMFMGLFDHYLLTIQQGNLILWGLLGLINSKS